MDIQQVGNHTDPHTIGSYIVSIFGISISAVTLLQVISITVGIAVGPASLVTMLLTYRSAHKRNMEQAKLAKAQREAIYFKDDKESEVN
jgi:hypothetical protein